MKQAHWAVLQPLAPARSRGTPDSEPSGLRVPSRRSHISLPFTAMTEATQSSPGFLGFTASSFMFFVNPRLNDVWKRKRTDTEPTDATTRKRSVRAEPAGAAEMHTHAHASKCTHIYVHMHASAQIVLREVSSHTYFPITHEERTTHSSFVSQKRDLCLAHSRCLIIPE